MKKITKLIVTILGFVFLFTNTSFAEKIIEKKFIPIVSDDLISMASYDKVTYTTINKLQVPELSDQNDYRDLVVQCEEDISYFLMAYMYYDGTSVTVDKGDVVIDERYNKDNVAYIKGHIEGNESIEITGNVFQNNAIVSSITKTCNSNIDDSAYPAIPNYPAGANSYGILELNCKDDIIYYTLSYACFKQTVKLSVKADGNPTHESKDSRQGSNPFIYYEFGYYERGGSTNKVEVVGTITDGNGGGPYSASCP